MLTTRAMSGSDRLGSLLQALPLTLGELGFVAIRMALDQAAGQAIHLLGEDVASLLDRVQADSLEPVGWLLDLLVVAGAVIGGWQASALGAIVTLVLPVGGPARGAVVLVSATYESVRGVSVRMVRPTGGLLLAAMPGGRPPARLSR